MKSIESGAIGRRLWAKSRENHPGPHSDWFWDFEKAGSGAILDLGCYCGEIARNFIGKEVLPVEVICWANTQVKPIDAEGHAIELVNYENGAIGQFEVSRTYRGEMDLRDEVMGTEGTIWSIHFCEPDLRCFRAEKGKIMESKRQKLYQGGFSPSETKPTSWAIPRCLWICLTRLKRGRRPRETFYDAM